MFRFFRKGYEPVMPKGHEGFGTQGRTTFQNDERTWEESFDLIRLLLSALKKHNIEATHRNGWLLLSDGLYLHPEVLAVVPLEAGGVRTATTVAVAHETLAPQGLFEYQHAAGEDTHAAFLAGFEGWIDLDLPVLLDAVRNTQKDCTAMDMELPEPASRKRRALLGPVAHTARRDSAIKEEHPFCPCCLLTHSFEAFKEQLHGEGFFGLRLLVARDTDGNVTADCRVNGLDWEPGKEHLLEYGKTWPDRGFEMRKQYVVIYSNAT